MTQSARSPAADLPVTPGPSLTRRCGFNSAHHCGEDSASSLLGISALIDHPRWRFFIAQMASYSADIAADLISEPSKGTNLDIAETDDEPTA
jgi:hypothetical protein